MHKEVLWARLESLSGSDRDMARSKKMRKNVQN
jgi:hypothetical protein